MVFGHYEWPAFCTQEHYSAVLEWHRGKTTRPPLFTMRELEAWRDRIDGGTSPAAGSFAEVAQRELRLAIEHLILRQRQDLAETYREQAHEHHSVLSSLLKEAREIEAEADRQSDNAATHGPLLDMLEAWAENNP